MPVSSFDEVEVSGSHPFYRDVTQIPAAILTVSAKNDGVPVPAGCVANHIVTIELTYKVTSPDGKEQEVMRTDVFPFGAGTQNSLYSINDNLDYFMMGITKVDENGTTIYQRIKIKFNGYINSYTFNMLTKCYSLLLFMKTEDLTTNGTRGF